MRASSSRAAPLAIEGAGDADTEACPIATSTKDASGAPLSIHLTADMATYMADGFGHAASARDIEDMTDSATPTTGAPAMPSSASSPMDTAISCASVTPWCYASI